ncbi:MAG: hypothetical protein M3Z04_04405 [Chloroflexota bacterium]|nr:hypothetical protein [Chloroflexota bacterium]
MTIKNLWGELPTTQELRTPKDILVEQAQILSDTTKRKLVGIAASQVFDKEVINDFSVVAPFLHNYEITLLQVKHSIINPYPAEVSNVIDGVRTECKDETALEATLAMILRSNEIHRIIAMLLAQSKDYSDAYAS